MGTSLDAFIVKLKKGKKISWQSVDCKKELVSIFGGSENFKWEFSNLTYVSLKDTKQKLCV